MHALMCVCVSVYVCVYIYVCVCVRVCVNAVRCINACTNTHSNCLCVLPTLNMPSQLNSWVWGVIVAWGDIGGLRSQALGSNSPRL